ncbi:MAG: hypothetical protein D6763_11985 [Alphaproteobacteria bacterium]|nr:MAG: hypothetical protein D6763_11985 [Alphaproteobacteria bacterium]
MKKVLAVTALGLWSGVAGTAYAGGLEQAIADGNILFDARLRYEHVDQDGFERNANALTLRSRFGFETAGYEGFSALVEGDFTRDLGVDNFNSTVNGRVQYPVVADPDSERLNRLQLTYTGPLGTWVTAGRQRILLDNNRFVGNVGFRQNEQTFDAIRFSTAPIDDFRLDYSYLWQVNRIFGSNSVAGEVDADTHLINLSYKTPVGTLGVYAYLIDLADLATVSNQTFGARFTGKTTLNDGLDVLYGAEYATQKDYGHNPGDFRLDYYLLEAGLAGRAWSFKASYEVLEGNGTQGFTTPLATLHKFQGFADVFLATSASGIRDLQVMADYRLGHVGVLGPVRLAVWYHDFEAETGTLDLGQEMDLGVFASPARRVKVSLEYADFWGGDNLASRRKLWFSINYSL